MLGQVPRGKAITQRCKRANPTVTRSRRSAVEVEPRTSAVIRRSPPAQAVQEHKAVKAEATTCSAEGQGRAVGAITFLEVKRDGLERKLLGSLGGAGQGLFRAQRFSPLRHRVGDFLAVLPFMGCTGNRAGSSTSPWEIRGAGKAPCVWQSKSGMGNGGGDGGGRSLTLPLSLSPGCSPAPARQDRLQTMTLLRLSFFFSRRCENPPASPAAHSPLPGPASRRSSKPPFLKDKSRAPLLLLFPDF